MLVLISLTATHLLFGGIERVYGQLPPVPQLSKWESDMKTYGNTHCDSLVAIKDGPLDPPLAATYYDAIQVFHNIGQYTQESKWRTTCTSVAKYVYAGRYVVPYNGVVAGYWNFTKGLTEDFLATGDVNSKIWAILLAKNASYASDTTPLSWTQGFGLSREVAYAMMGYMNAERLGEPRRARLAQLFEQALDHIRQWTENSDPDYAPFMFSLTAEALIQYHAQVAPDPRIFTMIKKGADYTWTKAWIPLKKAFFYRANDPATSAADLNLLIAPLYAWIYKETCDDSYRIKADAIFEGGVLGAWLVGAKQFNQNYLRSFEYLKRRSEGEAKCSGVKAPNAPSNLRIR